MNYYIALHCIVLYCIVLYCIVLYCIYCIVLPLKILYYIYYVHGCDCFFSTLPCPCLACVPVVVFVSCCHDVSVSRPPSGEQVMLSSQLVVYMPEGSHACGSRVCRWYLFI